MISNSKLNVKSLSSLSGIFANANLSILFSSRVDVIQLEKSLRIQNHQLLIPRADVEAFKSEILHSDKKSAVYKKIRKSLSPLVKLGTFSTMMNTLDRCPRNPNKLCLNMVGNKAPAFSIRLKMPLKKNKIIHQNDVKAKLAKIVTDATTRDVLQISINVINDSSHKKTFSILITNCKAASTAGKSSIMKSILPNFGETVTFLLPLMPDDKQKGGKFECDVFVKLRESETVKHNSLKRKTAVCQIQNLYKNTSLENYTTISSRTISIETEKRCFCIWECYCHCSAKLETHVDFNICQKMRYEDRKIAGMLSNNIHTKGQENFSYNAVAKKYRVIADNDATFIFTKNALILFVIMLLLGLLKALIGCSCSEYVDRCGFDYAQPGKGYQDSSGCRRFIINGVLFVIFPFFFWCKCFTTTNLDLLAASTEWKCENLRSSTSSENKSNHYGKTHFDSKNLDEGDNIILTQHIDCCSKFNISSVRDNSSIQRVSGGNVLCNMQKSQNLMPNEILKTTGCHGPDEEENIKYILGTLAESRESLRILLSTKNLLNVTSESDDKLLQAEEFVESLSEARIIYRKFDRPVGNVKNIPHGVKYCVQGYFLPTTEAKYEFVSYHPLVQYYGITSNGAFMEVLRPPVLLNPNDFSRVYHNSLDVCNAKDLYVNPPYCVPCINVYYCDFLAKIYNEV